MRKPKVGITPSARDGNPNRQYIPENYIKGIERAGGEWAVLPFHLRPGALRAATSNLDAVLFSGGPDVHPAFFGREKQPECGSILDERDILEMRLMELVYARRLPVMGICRGIQLINVALGGTLVQDIPTHYRTDHYQADRRTYFHTVNVAAGTMLSDITRSDSIKTNSYHHQSIDIPAPGMVVSAVADDGVIEAIELPGYRSFLLGLQWHPEGMLDGDPISIKYFERLIAAC